MGLVLYRVPVDAVLLPDGAPRDEDGDGREAGSEQAPQAASVPHLMAGFSTNQIPAALSLDKTRKRQ
jgi:hypothetical protein